MTRKRYTEERIIGILKEAGTGVVVADLCRKHGMSSATYCAWEAKFGGLGAPAAICLASSVTCSLPQ